MRVAVAEDSGLFRQALERLLEAVGVEVLGSFPEANALMAYLDADPDALDAVILDLHLPPTFTDEGSRAALRIRRAHPGVGVLILSAFNETPQAISLFEQGLGGVGYLLKDNVTDVATLRGCLRRIASGEAVIDPMVVSRLLSARRTSQQIEAMSQRERSVLALMAEGYSNAGIARRLSVSARTAEDHVQAVFGKLGLGHAVRAQTDTNKRVLAVLTWLRAVRVLDLARAPDPAEASPLRDP